MTRLSLAVLLVLISIPACKKDQKAGEDAAAEAAVVEAVDAAPEAEAPDASTTPLATPPVVKVAPKVAPDPPVCAAARSAKARNSPAAANLEHQCKAQGGKL